MSTHEIAEEIADEPQPTVDPALNIQPHRQSPTPETKFETANSGHSSPQSTRSNRQNDNFQDINPLIQSTQHELRAIEVTNPMSSASEQPTPELASNFAPESAISRETYINVQSSTIPERNDGQYLDKNASPAEVTDYLRGLQSKLDTILKSSVVLHQSPMTSPVKSHSTFPTKDRVDSMYSPSNDLFKFSNNFSDFNSFKARPVGDSVYASVNNDAKFFSAREAPKSSYTSNRYDNINSSMVNLNGSMIGKSNVVGSPMTTLSTYIPPNPSSQYSSIQKDRNHQVIEAMKTNEAKLDQIIENIRRKNAGGAVGAVKTTESRVNTIASPQVYNSRVTIASPQSMTRKTEFYNQSVETIKKSSFVPNSEYSSIEFRDREKKRSFQHDRQPSISNSYFLDSHEKSKYLGASTISNTHVPLKLRADRNNPAEQSDREIVQEEGHQKIQRYYIPDPTVKERDTKDHNDMRAMQSRPLQFGGSNTGPARREYRNDQRHLEVLEDDSAFHCQDLEDDNQSELGETQPQRQEEPIKINQEEFVYGGSATFTNKRGHQSKVEKPKVVVTKKNLEKVSQVQVKKEPSSGVERSQPSSSISKFFEKDSEIDDFVFE